MLLSTRIALTLAFFAALLLPGISQAAPVPDGSLAILPVTQLTQEETTQLEKECWLLGHSTDFAVILLEDGQDIPSRLESQLQKIEAPRSPGGDYYLFVVQDAATARIEAPGEVLWRQGHTMLIWSSETPKLTATSRDEQRGLQQPIRLQLAPRSWRALIARAPQRQERTDFDPIVSQIVADVSLTEYVTQWQILDDFETRYYSKPQNEQAAIWMHDEFIALGLEAEYHEYSHNGTRKNVIGTHLGLVHPEKVVYITGHFDSISSDEDHAPGADDNASGTACFLEAARVLSQYQFEYTIKFAGFSSEEQGLIGSAAYVSYIAGQGEDVVGCYNIDMIAYRGTDPAPADLVIYTDSGSQWMAAIIEDACLEFLPTDLEPVVLVEALSASDHASFWNHGYDAICGIEEEAWGPDFCPWYHTSNDRIEQYPQDYPTHCTTVAIAAVAHTAIPMLPDTPYLQVDSFVVDDDDSGASQGNGNGIIEYAETIELTVTLNNVGQQDGVGVTGQLLIDDEYIDLIIDQGSFGTIPALGGTGSNTTPFLFAVSADVPDGRQLDFQLDISTPPDMLDIDLMAYAPFLQAIAFDVDDQAGGNGNGIPEPGEDLVLSLTVENSGSVTAPGVSCVLNGGAYLTADPAPRLYGDMISGAQTSADFEVAVSAACPDLYSSALFLDILDAGGYDRTDAISFNIGDIFQDDIEDGGVGWTHYVGGGSFSDQWHVESYRNHTYGGGASWKCGGAGAADYGNLLYAVLESSPFTLPSGSVLTFWHWIEAEVSSAYQGYAYDGGLLEISIDGGPWESIEPVGGYPFLVREGGTPGPFPSETPFYSGSHDWEQAVFDLGSYEGSARVRFAFGSDGSATREGWYIDDLLLTIETSDADGTLQTTVRRLELAPVSQNPTRQGTVLQLNLPEQGHVAVRVYDATGRVVRTLHEGSLAAGTHTLHWDGLGGGDAPASPGVYFIRADAEEGHQTMRVSIVR